MSGLTDRLDCILKCEQVGMCLKYADGMANSADPGQTAISGEV